jgi:hypothetical protein
MDEQACREALYGERREVRAEPLTRKADPKRAGERIRREFERRARGRGEEEAA